LNPASAWPLIELLPGELATLEQDAVGNRDLADVVQLTGETHKLAILLGEPHLPSQDLAVGVHAVYVMPCLFVTELHQPHQPEDRVGLRHRHSSLGPGKLTQSLLQLAIALVHLDPQALHETPVLGFAAPAAERVGDIDEQLPRSDRLDEIAIGAMLGRRHR
jgi:hypothetical protein